MPDRLVDLGAHPAPPSTDPMVVLVACPRCARPLYSLARSLLGTEIERRQRQYAEGLVGFCPCKVASA